MASDTTREISLILTAHDKGMKAGLKKATTELNKLEKSSKKTNLSLSKLGKSMKNASVGVHSLAAAYAGLRAAKAVTSTVLNFNHAIAEISTLTDVSADSLSGLSDELVSLSTKIPQSAGQLATATYDIISAGVALEDTTGVLELSAKAAIAGVTDTQTAVNAGVGVMNAYGESVEGLEAIYDTLFQTVKLGVVRFEDLANNLGKVTPIARSAGVNFTSLSAAIATLTKGGLSAEIASTALRGAITALSSATPEAKKKLDSLGITWTNLEDTIRQISEQNLGAEAMRQIIPDVRARTAVLTLSNNYEQLVETLGKFETKAGSMTTAYEKMMESTKNQFELLKNNLTAAILQNEKFREVLKGVSQDGSDAAVGLGELASAMATLAANSTLGWSAIAAYTAALVEQNLAERLSWEAKVDQIALLADVADATDRSTVSMNDFTEMLRLGVIEWDKSTGAMEVNLINLDLYNQGLLIAGESGKDFTSVIRDMGDEMGDVGDEFVALAEVANSAASTISKDLGAIGDEIDNVQMSQSEFLEQAYVRLGELVRQGKEGAAEYIALMSEIDQAQQEMGTKTAAAYKKSYALITAELKLAFANNLITEEQYHTKSLQATKAHLEAQVKATEAAIKAMVAAGEAGTEAFDKNNTKLADLKTELIGVEKELQGVGEETGRVMAESGRAGEESWEAFAKQVGITVSELKSAIKDVTEEIDAGMKHLLEWREQTKRTQYKASPESYVEGFQGASDAELRRELEKQRKIATSLGQWVSPEQRGAAQQTARLIEELLRSREAAKWNTTATENSTTATNNLTRATEESTEQNERNIASGYADGGMVPGRGTGDTVNAWLTPGEIVLPVPVIKSGKIAEFLAGLDNRLAIPQIPRFAQGGMVKPTNTVTLNFAFDGKEHRGVFPADVAGSLVKELQQAAMVQR